MRTRLLLLNSLSAATLPIDQYAQGVIQAVGIFCGLCMLLGFLAMMHETWRQPISKLPMILAIFGLTAEVLAVAFMPDLIILVIPFTFAGSAAFAWQTVSTIRRLIDLGGDLGYQPAKAPLFPTVAKLAIFLVLAVAIVAGINHNGKTLAHSTNSYIKTSQQTTKKVNQISQKVDTVKSRVDSVNDKLDSESLKSLNARQKQYRSDKEFGDNLAALTKSAGLPKRRVKTEKSLEQAPVYKIIPGSQSVIMNRQIVPLPKEYKPKSSPKKGFFGELFGETVSDHENPVLSDSLNVTPN